MSQEEWSERVTQAREALDDHMELQVDLMVLECQMTEQECLEAQATWLAEYDQISKEVMVLQEESQVG